MDAAADCEDFFASNSTLFANWDDPPYDAEAERPDVLLGELLLCYLEFMGLHKVTDRCARSVHTLLCLLLPTDTTLPKWATLKRLLEEVFTQTVVAVHLCVNDCISYYDTDHPRLNYRHAHRSYCPYCAEPRYIESEGKQIPRRVGYYFPLDHWMSAMFKDKGLQANIEHLAGVGEFPPGHVRFSRGWHEKMTDNPHMYCEPRNQALIGMSDGIPLFRDKNSRSCVPIALRQANQPDSISKNFKYMHLSALYPCDYWCLDSTSKEPVKLSHKPSNLGPLLVCLVNDLQHWYDGKHVVDYFKAEGDLQRKFLLRTVLLFWCGDYPGLGEATNFRHSGYYGCHWCKDRGEYSKGLNRMVWGRYRRYIYMTV